MLSANQPTVVHVPGVEAKTQRTKGHALDRIWFPHTAWLLFLLLPFIAIGFWPGYWSQLHDPQNTTVIHIHTAFMMAWVVMGLVQPILILRKKMKPHRFIGQISYGLMPLLLLSGYFLIQQRYHRLLEKITADVATGKAPIKADAIGATAASAMGLGLVYFGLLTALFTLAIVNRKKFVAHGTYMLGAILTALGPSVDRIIGQVCKANGWTMNFWNANATLLFTILLFFALAFYQKRKGQKVQPALLTASLYIAALLILEFGTKAKAWQSFVEAIF
jgi:hypothetical protein